MKTPASSDAFLFADFRFDRAGGGLFRRDGHGAFAPVTIGSRALDLLAVLIERRGDVVSKDEIMAAVWPKTAVEETNLFFQVSALRAILDKERSGQSCIQTVAGRGYRFIAPVTRDAGLGSTPAEMVEPTHADSASKRGDAAPGASERRHITALTAGSVGGIACKQPASLRSMRRRVTSSTNSGTPLVRSLTPSTTSLDSAWREAIPPTICRTCARSSGAREIAL
jgi:DNA-binding winged helix-turn-helix (wHTH) protein